VQQSDIKSLFSPNEKSTHLKEAGNIFINDKEYTESFDNSKS
jgi:hypothetical protein